MILPARLAFASLLIASASLAAAAPPPAPANNPPVVPHVMGTPFLLARPGKVLFEDDFARAELGPKWKKGKGFWMMEDGALRAAENPDDKHGAYTKAPFAFKDVMAQVRFKLDGSTSFNFTVDDLAYKGSHAGHICNVTVTPTQVRLADTKTGGMKNEVYEKLKDPATAAEQKKQIQASIKDTQAVFKMPIETGKWHLLRMEILGDEMLVSLDDKPVGYLKSEGIDHPTKALLGFTIGGKSTLIDDVKVWEATPAAEWAERRDKVLATLKK
jgi:hypothetical protein